MHWLGVRRRLGRRRLTTAVVVLAALSFPISPLSSFASAGTPSSTGERLQTARVAPGQISTGATAATVATVATGAIGATAATVAEPGPIKPGQSTLVDTSPRLEAGLGTGTGQKAVFIRLSGLGLFETSADAVSGGDDPKTVKGLLSGRRKWINAQAALLTKMATKADPNTFELFQVANAVPGIGLSTSPAVLRFIAALPQVVSIAALVPKTPASVSTSELAAANAAIAPRIAEANPGTGIRIGIIDTGIDYTQADFGGPGTPAAYESASADSTGPWHPSVKVAGGRDFVGDAYDPAPELDSGGANPAYNPDPHPDGNPLDCNGHGTQVAGAAAGYGVTAAGTPMPVAAVDTDNTSPAALSLRVSPGSAPGATLYALKIFGCSASETDAVIPALDWALDPNGDGDFVDRLDVVDLSLSSTYSTLDDPDNVVLDAVAQAGVLPVVAAGNDGDVTDAIGSPGDSNRALTVASSMDAVRRLDGLRVGQTGSSGAGALAGQASVAYPWSSAADVNGSLVALSAADSDGCSPLSAADAAAVAGKVAWLTWDDNDATRACGSTVRSANVRAAGAVGAVLTSSDPVFSAAITGDPIIPVFQLTPAATALLAPFVGLGATVTFSGSLLGAETVIDPTVADLLGTYSSRGAAGGPKPDIAAPGNSVLAAGMGTGKSSDLGSGTSMAAATVAGVAAQVIAAHPNYTPEQVKAAIMNSATHDVYTGPSLTGSVYPPGRVGAGRVDPIAAVSQQVLAYSSTAAGSVAASFGIVGAPATSTSVVSTQSIEVQNASADPVALSLSYQNVTLQPGVQFSVSPTTMNLAVGAAALATVTMTISPAELRRTADPTMATQQIDPLTGLDEARQFVSDDSGRMVISQTGGPTIRVPVYAAARPTSATTSVDGTVSGGPGVVLQGQGFDQKSPADGDSTRFSSLTSVLDLGYQSPVLPSCSTAGTGQCTAAASSDAQSAGDIEAVGAGVSPSSDGSSGDLWFGLSTYGDFSSVGTDLLPTVGIDTDGDGSADFTIQVRAVGSSTDLLYAYLYRGASLIDVYPVNFNLGDTDTDVFNNSALLIPVDLASLGIPAGAHSFPARYRVSMYSPADSISADGDVDSTPWIPFDIAHPAFMTNSPLWVDQGNTGIPYTLGPGVTSATALILHLAGADGVKQEIITLDGQQG